MLRDSLVALSLSNLLFVDIWKLFLIPHSTFYPYYQWKLNPAPLLLATILDVLLLSVILLVAITFARRAQREFILPIARSIFVVVFVLVAVNLLVITAANPPLGPLLKTLIRRPRLLFDWQGISNIYSWLAVLGLLSGMGGITLMIHSLIYRRQQLIRLSVTILLITAPFVLVTFTQAATQWIRYRAGEQFGKKAAPALPQQGNSQRRILWLIFDELDLRLSFVDRPPTLNLPEFDRLREESIFASNAYPPGGDTELSLPALIDGSFVSRINRSAPNELLVFGDNDQSTSWSSRPNVFSRARGMGLNSGLAGWYHPYCRVIGSSLTQCSWEATSLLFLPNTELADLICFSEHVSVVRGMVRVAGSVLLPAMIRLFLPKDPSLWRKYVFKEFNGIHQRSLAMAADTNLQLILVHYPIPHPPGVYDRYKNDFSFNSSSGYLDNLVLADRVLKELRQKMTEAGVWESTTVLISSDHRLRADRVWRDHQLWKPSLTKEDPVVLNSTPDERVPFILRLAGESKSVIYEPAFNTVLSSELILAVLSGEITKKEDAVEWLDLHRSIAESPYLQRAKDN
ncbi:MAG: sulfatase-like hydrolase/transferase [Pyrinomonadaceae bacterium]